MQTHTSIAEALLTQHGYECCICPVFDDSSKALYLAAIKTAKLTDVAAAARLIMLSAVTGRFSVSAYLRRFLVPILGVNLGNKGFLPNWSRHETDCILKWPTAITRYRRA